MPVVSRNITIDPVSPATPVDTPEIVEVMDLVKGDILNSTAFITSHRYDAFVEKRVRVLEAMKDDQPLFACALCGTPVYFVSSPEKRFFFRHRAEDGSCPAQTRSLLTEAEIRARKYLGLRESERHKRIKWLIQSLAADPLFQTESIVQERRWRSQRDPARWRQPDVQATCDGQRIAFEAQLSTTFLDVVVERRRFYREEDALLVWMVGEFDPGDRRLTIDDLLFSNNSNILVVDDETTRLSQERRAFHVRCHLRRVSREGDAIVETWDAQTVSFHELTRDIERQQAYLFDSKGMKEQLAAEIDRELRTAFFELWGSIEFPYDKRPEMRERWRAIRAKLARRHIAIPEAPHTDRSFRAMIHGLLSAGRGGPIGWGFDQLIQVAHHLAEDYPQHLLAFGFALEVSGHKKRVADQDATGKWARRRQAIREKILARDPKFMPDESWRAALSFLFPDIAAKLASFVVRPAEGCCGAGELSGRAHQDKKC
jgi:hypothetical protein